MRRWVQLGIVFALLVAGRYSAAHTSSELIFLRAGERADMGYGDLYAYAPGQPEPERLTTSGYNQSPVMSPDLEWLAYRAAPEALLQLARAGDYNFDRDRDAPSDIWLLNLASRVTTRLTTQPLDDGQTRKGQWRTPPVWSPDAQKLAWVETDPDDSGNGRLAVYDIASRIISIWARGLPLGFGEAGIFHVYDQLGWGSYIANAGTPLFGETAPVLTAQIISEEGIVLEEPHAGSSWLLHEGAWFLFVNDPLIPVRQIFNPLTGERLGLVNPPLRQTMSGSGLRLRVVNNEIEIIRADGSQTMLDTPDAANIQLSPDGQTLAFLLDKRIYIWRDGEASVPLLSGAAAEWEILDIEWSPTIGVSDGQTMPLPPPLTPTPTPQPQPQG